jgi:EpsI family protein
MINRRDVLIGAGCMVALGAAEYLRPRRMLTLLNEKLETAVPRQIGPWLAERGGDFVVPQRDGSLSERLYASQILRSYRRSETSAPIMLVIAYGGAQSDALQLHRPEACYPAVGFRILNRKLFDLPVARAVGIPAVAMTALAGGRIEDIIYWTRLGEYLPQTAGQQGRDRLATSMDGYIGDGVLVRASVVRMGPMANYDEVGEFLRLLVLSLAPAVRPGFVGTVISRKLAT